VSTAAVWAAPTPTGGLDAVVTLPGSKSATARALVLAALADAPTRLVGPLRARDTDLMADGLRALGVTIAREGDDWLVTPGPLRGPAAIDCGLAGTVMRFLLPVAALATGDVAFDGDPRARQRPLGGLIDALRDLAVVVDDGGTGTLPVVVHGTGAVTGGPVAVDAAASSQFVSALLLAGCRFGAGIDLAVPGALPSAPHVTMTIAMLRDRGVDVTEVGSQRWVVHPGQPCGGVVPIEPDLSNAAAFLAAALVVGGSVRIPGWPSRTDQPGDDLRRILAAMGAAVDLSGAGLTVTGTGRIAGADLDLGHAGELTPVVAALAALADSPSRLRGIAHLRGHETDRLAALTTEIRRLGGDATETDDGLVITPRPLAAAVVRTYHDHRMAHFAAVIGLAVPGVGIEEVATTAKTMPDFVDRWTALATSTGAA
jgi:3-phosphoshikimate 1-carboxyvinyltransferase